MAEASQGTVLKPGTLYMSHGDYHIEITKKGDELRFKNSNLAPVNGFRPSIDHLFRSAAVVDVRIFAALLTGMGKDGAQGLFDLKKKGATTFAQDEDSCIVFGMPKAAIALNAVQFVGNLNEIRAEMKTAITSS